MIPTPARKRNLAVAALDDEHSGLGFQRSQPSDVALAVEDLPLLTESFLEVSQGPAVPVPDPAQRPVGRLDLALEPHFTARSFGGATLRGAAVFLATVFLTGAFFAAVLVGAFFAFVVLLAGCFLAVAVLRALRRS